MQARAVEDNVMKNIAPDEKAATVKHNDAEKSAMEGSTALKNAKKNDELKSKNCKWRIWKSDLFMPKFIKLRTGSKLEKTDLCQEGWDKLCQKFRDL